MLSDMNKYINFKTFEEYLRELERAQTDGQTDRQTNRMHKHFSTLLESLKKEASIFLVMALLIE